MFPKQMQTHFSGYHVILIKKYLAKMISNYSLLSLFYLYWIEWDFLKF